MYDDLKKQLEEIAMLEKENDLSGVNLNTRKGVRVVTDQAVVYVTKAIKSGLEILNNKDYVKVIAREIKK